MKVKDQIIEFLVKYGFQILGGLVILAAGFFAARVMGRLVQRSLRRFKLELPVEMLLVRLVKLVIIGLTAVLTVAKMGVDIAPLVAGIGVIGVGVGLAAQGVLSNIFAGFLIIFAKPFRLGEYIEIHGVDGVVHHIGLISTKLMHFDKSIVVIPNRKIIGEILHNYGTIRQVELKVGVAYNSNMEKVDAIIREVLSQNPRVLKEPGAVIGVTELDDSSIDIAIKPWVGVPDYPLAGGEIYKAILKAFAGAGIELPFPHRDIRVLNYPAGAETLGRMGVRQETGI
jgi:small conductance mechanosensitive channel